MDGRGTRLDVRLHDLERVQRPAEAGLGVGDDRREPVPLVVALGVRDLVRAEQRVRDAPRERRPRVRGVEALVGIRAADEVRVRGHLPARQVDRLEARPHHLHRLTAGHRAECGNPVTRVQQVTEPLGAEPRERVLDPHRAAQALDVLGAVRAGDDVGHARPFGSKIDSYWILDERFMGRKGIFSVIWDPK